MDSNQTNFFPVCGEIFRSQAIGLLETIAKFEYIWRRYSFAPWNK